MKTESHKFYNNLKSRENIENNENKYVDEIILDETVD